MERQALTARAVEREYGIRRQRIAEAVRAGELRAARLGARRLLILRRDLELWLASYAVRPQSRTARVIARRLEHEQRRAAREGSTP